MNSTEPIRVTCPICDKRYKLDPKYAGRTFACRTIGCGRVIRVPAMGEVSEPKKRAGPPPLPAITSQVGTPRELQTPEDKQKELRKRMASDAVIGETRRRRPHWVWLTGLTGVLVILGGLAIAIYSGLESESTGNKETDSVFRALEKAGLLGNDVTANAITGSLNEMAQVGCERVAIPFVVTDRSPKQVPDWKIGRTTDQFLGSNLMDLRARNALIRRKAWPVFRQPLPSIDRIKQVIGSPKISANVKGWMVTDMDTGRVIESAPSFVRLEYGAVSILAADHDGQLTPSELQIDLTSLPDFRKNLQKRVTGSWALDSDAYGDEIKATELTDKFTSKQRDTMLANAPVAKFNLRLNEDGSGELSWSAFRFIDKQEGHVVGKWIDHDEIPAEGAGVHFLAPEMLWDFMPDGENLVFKVSFDGPLVRLKRVRK